MRRKSRRSKAIKMVARNVVPSNVDRAQDLFPSWTLTMMITNDRSSWTMADNHQDTLQRSHRRIRVGRGRVDWVWGHCYLRIPSLLHANRPEQEVKLVLPHCPKEINTFVYENQSSSLHYKHYFSSDAVVALSILSFGSNHGLSVCQLDCSTSSREPINRIRDTNFKKTT